jgi:hypothetical protein
VYGGPTFDPVSGTGFHTDPTSSFIQPARFNAGDGIATGEGTNLVNNASTNYAGVTAEWGIGGAVVLPSLANPNAPVTRIGSQPIYGFDRKYVNGQDVGGRAVRWNAAGQIAEMAYPGVSSNLAYSRVSAVNSAGVSVGEYSLSVQNPDNFTISELYRRPLRWSADGTVATQLGVLGTGSGGNSIATASDINALGVTVGSADKWISGVPVGSRAVRWDANSTTAVELPSPMLAGQAAVRSYATKINSAGAVVGIGYFPASGAATYRAVVRWNAGTYTPEVLDGLNTAVNGSYGYPTVAAFNDAGTAVGTATPTEDISLAGARAVRWDSGTTAITKLGLIAGGTSNTNTYAFDVNNQGLAVGMQRAGNAGVGTAVLWGVDGAATNLNSLIDPASNWVLIEADSISDTNWVAGVGRYDPDGAGPIAAYNRPFLIQVPEPSLGILMATLFPLLRRRRR